MARRVLAWALAVWWCGCGAQDGPALGPPPPPPAEAPATVEPPTTTEPTPEPPQPDAQASPPPAEAPASPEAPKATVWRKVDLVGSSVEMPEPFTLQNAPDNSDYPGAKFVYSNLKVSSFIAGEGKFDFDRALLVGRLLEEPIQHSLTLSAKQTRIKGKDFEDRRVLINHMNGMITMARIWIWPSRGKKLGRFAFRAATLRGKDDDSLRAPQFLDDLGPEPAGKREMIWGLVEVSELRRHVANVTTWRDLSLIRWMALLGP